MPSATSASKKSRALRGWSWSRLVKAAASSAPLANSVNSPSSMALSMVFDSQNPVPSCMIFTGVNRLFAIWSPLSSLLSVLSAPDILQILRFSCEVVQDFLMRRSVRSPVPPEVVECGIDFLCIESIGVRVSFVFQIGYDGAGFLSGENGKPATCMIVPGHGPISSWIDERRFADRLLVDPLPSRDLHDMVEKSIREVKHRIGSLQLLTEIGDHISGQEIPKAPFGEETESVVVRIEQSRVQSCPIGDADERRDRFARLAPFVAPL